MEIIDPAYRSALAPPGEIQRRVATVQGHLREARLDGLVLLQPVDLFYFSGTQPSGHMWIPVEGEPTLWVHKGLERARTESPLADIRSTQDEEQLGSRVEAVAASRIGVEMDVLPAGELARLQRRVPGRSWTDASRLIRRTRQVKSAYELEWMRTAGRRHGRVFAEIATWLRPGQTELEISARIEYAMRLAGHQGLVRMRRWDQSLFYGPVVSGASACCPTSFDGPVGALGLYPAVPQGAGRRKVRQGDPVLIDLVFGCGGYYVDKSRTFVLGPAPGRIRDALALCLEMQEAVRVRLRPGFACSEIYRQVLDTFPVESPFRPHFMDRGPNAVGFLGHGVGLELDEWPVLAPRFDEVLAPGMTLAVEPKIFLPGLGGVGVENTFLVTEGEAEKLTDYPDDLIVV